MSQSDREAEDGVRLTPLTAEELQSFDEHGYLEPGRLLSEDDTDRIAEAVQEHFEGRFDETIIYDFADVHHDTVRGLPLVEPRSAKADIARREKATRSLPILMNLWEIDPRLKEVAMNPIAAGWAAQILRAEEVLLFDDTGFVKPARKGAALHWHQDYSFFPVATPAIVTFWIALDDVSPENGTIKYAVGTHKRGEVLPVSSLSVKSTLDTAPICTTIVRGCQRSTTLSLRE